MRTKLLTPGRLGARLATASTLFLVCLSGMAQAQPKSPVGTLWDCVESGERNGLAYMTFSGNGTMEIVEVIVPKLPPSPRPSLLAGGGIGSNGLGVSTNQPTHADIFGSEGPTGNWGFDTKGHIVGSFIEVAVPEICTTTRILVSTEIGTNASAISLTNQNSGDESCDVITVGRPLYPCGFTNQTICYQNHFPISTTTFPSPNQVPTTNQIAGGTEQCETTPVFTNAMVFSGTNQTTCCSNGVCETTDYPSPVPITQTTTSADGTFCVISPIFTNAMLFSGTNETTCFIDHVPVSTNTFVSATQITETAILPDNTVCVTLPLSSALCPSNYLVLTNCYVLQVDCKDSLTNFINFVGTVVPGKRLTLKCTTSFGNLVFSGVPARYDLPDLRGSWEGIKKQNGTPSYEFFDLSGGPFIYQVINGVAAPDFYEYAHPPTNGIAIVSQKNKIAFAFDIILGTNYQSTRAVMGSFNRKKLSGNTTGFDKSGEGGFTKTNQVNFSVTKRTSVP